MPRRGSAPTNGPSALSTSPFRAKPAWFRCRLGTHEYDPSFKSQLTAHPSPPSQPPLPLRLPRRGSSPINGPSVPPPSCLGEMPLRLLALTHTLTHAHVLCLSNSPSQCFGPFHTFLRCSSRALAPLLGRTPSRTPASSVSLTHSPPYTHDQCLAFPRTRYLTQTHPLSNTKSCQASP